MCSLDYLYLQASPVSAGFSVIFSIVNWSLSLSSVVSFVFVFSELVCCSDQYWELSRGGGRWSFPAQGRRAQTARFLLLRHLTLSFSSAFSEQHPSWRFYRAHFCWMRCCHRKWRGSSTLEADGFPASQPWPPTFLICPFHRNQNDTSS